MPVTEVVSVQLGMPTPVSKLPLVKTSAASLTALLTQSEASPSTSAIGSLLIVVPTPTKNILAPVRAGKTLLNTISVLHFAGFETRQPVNHPANRQKFSTNTCYARGNHCRRPSERLSNSLAI